MVGSAVCEVRYWLLQTGEVLLGSHQRALLVDPYFHGKDCIFRSSWSARHALLRIPMMVMGDSDLIVMVVSERNDHHDRSEATLTL
jgi:hypothetical protein